jgi:hypothetical protein
MFFTNLCDYLSNIDYMNPIDVGLEGSEGSWGHLGSGGSGDPNP